MEEEKNTSEQAQTKQSVVRSMQNNPAPWDANANGVKISTGISAKIKVLISVFVVAIVSAIGIGAYLLLRTPSHIPSDPNELLFRAAEELLLAKDMSFRISIPGDTVSASGVEKYKESAEETTGLDVNDVDVVVDFDIVLGDYKTSQVASRISVKSQESEKAAFEFRKIGEDNFLKLSAYENEKMPFDLSMLLNNWIHFNVDSIKKQVKQLGGVSKKDENVESEFKVGDVVKHDTKKNLETVKEIYKRQTPFQLTLVEENQATGIAKIHVQPTEYTFNFFVESFVQSYSLYLSEVEQVIREKQSVGDKVALDALLSYKEKIIDEFGEKGEYIETKMRDEFNMRFLKDTNSPLNDVVVLMTFDLNTGRVKSMEFQLIFKDGILRDSIILEWSGYNTGLKIDAPEQTIGVEEAISMLFGSFFGKAELEAQMENVEIDGDSVKKIDEIDPHADKDSDGLTNGEEKLHGTDANNPDSDNDGYLDGQEVKNGYDPLSNNKSASN